MLALDQENILQEQSPEDEIIQGRKEKRYTARGRAKMAETEMELKDVSLGGGCVQASGFIDVIPNSTCTIAIIPETESQLEAFEVDIMSRWVRMHRHSSELGFAMHTPPGSQSLANYIDFLKTRDNGPDR